MTLAHRPPDMTVNTVDTLRALRELVDQHSDAGARLRALVPAIEAIIAGTPGLLVQCPQCAHPFDVMHQDEVVRSGDLVVNLTGKFVTKAGEHVPLSKHEWQLLEVLVRRPGHVVHHDELIVAAFGSEYRGEQQYLRVWISRVRGRIGGEYIANEPARGHRFVLLPVVAVEEGDAA